MWRRLPVPLLLLAAAVGLLVWRAPDVRGPNVVLVIACTVRADQTSPYGAPAEVTPFLSSLAADGVRFEDLVSVTPWTRPSSASLLTGAWPETIGMVEPDDGRSDRSLPDEVQTLAERLKARGYRTIGLTANPNLGATFQFDQGFDTYVDTALWRRGVTKVGGLDLVTDALRLLDRSEPLRGRRPFYLQLVLVDAHQPADLEDHEIEPFREDGLPQRVARYRALLHRLDGALAELDRGLRARGHDPSDTLLVVVGDHGEGLSFPSHHGRAHGRYLYPSALHVPLVLRGPGVARGHVVGGLASSVDLLPTLGALLDLDVPDAPGIAMGEQVRGEQDRTGRERAFATSWFQAVRRSAVYTDEKACFADHAPERAAAEQAALRRKSFPPFVDGCFDRKQDPEMVRPPAEDPVLQGELAAHWALREAEATQAGALRGVVDEALLESLRGLGYVE